MPTRPPSHKAHRFHDRTADDRAYNHLQRKLNPLLWSAQQVRNSARWRRLRRMVLNRAPLCADPYGVHAAWGRLEPAVEVDHIVPLVEDLSLAYDEVNLQPLCLACHSRKSALERKQHTLRASRGYSGRGSSD
jgi:5-methylcytosine-specific restriction endonuclease McrA